MFGIGNGNRNRIKATASRSWTAPSVCASDRTLAFACTIMHFLPCRDRAVTDGRQPGSEGVNGMHACRASDDEWGRRKRVGGGRGKKVEKVSTKLETEERQ